MWSAIPGGRDAFAFARAQLLRTDHEDPATNEAATALLPTDGQGPRRAARSGGRSPAWPSSWRWPRSRGSTASAVRRRPARTACSGPRRSRPSSCPQTVVVWATACTVVDATIADGPPPTIAPLAVDVPPAPSGPTVRDRARPGGRRPLGRQGRQRPTSACSPARAEAYAWLAELLTVERLRALMPAETEGLEVRRYELPNLWALNFVIVGLLEEGVAGEQPHGRPGQEPGRVPAGQGRRRARGRCSTASRCRVDGRRGNLFATIRAAAPDPSSVLAELPDGTVATYGDAFALAARFAHVLQGPGSVRATGSPCRSRSRGPRSCSTSAACGRAPSTCRSTPRTRRPRSTTSSATPSRSCSSAARSGATTWPRSSPRPGWLGWRRWAAEGRGSLLEAADAAPPECADVERDGRDLAAILYTSGTTGRSKGAMLTHDNLRSNALALVECWRFTADDVLVHALPIFHTHGLFVATNVVLLSGGSMIFLPTFDAGQVLAALGRATALMGVPTFYTRLLAQPGLTAEAVAGVRLFVSGSAPLLAETHQEWSERTGHAILERYGMTETNMNTSNPYDGERRPGTVGFPLPGVEVRVVDAESGAVVGPGRIGVLRGPGPERVRRVLAPAGEDRRGPAPGRLLRHRRPGRDRRRRLRAHRRPGQGPDHLRRSERLPQGGRGPHRRPARGGRVGRLRRAPPGLRRGGGRRRRAPRSAARSTARPSSPGSTGSWPGSSSPRPCSSSTSCRATRWPRSRRPPCARSTAGRSRSPPAARPEARRRSARGAWRWWRCGAGRRRPRPVRRPPARRPSARGRPGWAR